MALNFPSSPILNQVYTNNNKSWLFNGVSWVATNIAMPGQYLGTSAIKIISYNGKTISENITIPAAYNAMSVGPISIGDGFMVTIEDGATWVII